MTQVKDLNKKRVCDISDDRKTVFIRRGDCVTEVRAEKDGREIQLLRCTRTAVSRSGGSNLMVRY